MHVNKGARAGSLAASFLSVSMRLRVSAWAISPRPRSIKEDDDMLTNDTCLLPRVFILRLNLHLRLQGQLFLKGLNELLSSIMIEERNNNQYRTERSGTGADL